MTISSNIVVCSKIVELEEELKVVGNNMKSLELSEQEVKSAFDDFYLPVCVTSTDHQHWSSFGRLCFSFNYIFDFFVLVLPLAVTF